MLQRNVTEPFGRSVCSITLRVFARSSALGCCAGGQTQQAVWPEISASDLVARGIDGWVKNSVDAPRLTKRLRLPTFERDVPHPFLWPPPP